MRGRAIFWIDFSKFSKSYFKNLSITAIVFPRVMRLAGVALPSFLKARQVLAGWGDALSCDLLGRRVGDRVRIGVVAAGDVRAVEFELRVAISPVSRRHLTREARRGHDDAAQPAPGGAKRGRFREGPNRNARRRHLGRRSARRGPGLRRRRSMAGTKTDTPLMETPQAISVIGREQIRDQNPDS